MKPPVVTWFKAYCAVLTLMYVVLIPVGIIFLKMDPATFEMEPTEAIVMGIMLVGISIPLVIACALPFFLRPAPWVWVYDLVLICLGMTSCCFMVASIPLLIFWIKPETKKYFGK